MVFLWPSNDFPIVPMVFLWFSKAVSLVTTASPTGTGRHRAAARPDGGSLQPGPDGPHLLEAAEVAAEFAGEVLGNPRRMWNGIRDGISLGFNVIHMYIYIYM